MRVKRDGRDVKVEVMADGAGLVSHAGAALIAEIADRLGLTSALDRELGRSRALARHSPGRVIRDLAVMLADGGDALCDLAAVRDQQALFGPVASDSTAYRLIAGSPPTGRAGADQRGARGGQGARVAVGARPRLVVIDLDATLLIAHSERRARPATSRAATAFTRCSPTSTAPRRRSPACCAPATRAPTPPPTRSRSSTPRCSRCPSASRRASRSWSAPTAPAPRTN